MKADKFSDLFRWKNWWRYWKIGFILTIIYGLVIWLIQWIQGFIGFNIDNKQLMASLQAGGIGLTIVFFVGLIIQLIVSGFLIEWVNNAKNVVVKWANR